MPLDTLAPAPRSNVNFGVVGSVSFRTCRRLSRVRMFGMFQLNSAALASATYVYLLRLGRVPRLLEVCGEDQFYPIRRATSTPFAISRSA